MIKSKQFSLLDDYIQSTEKKDWNNAVIAYLASLDTISKNNPDLTFSILQELASQRSHLKMIASENFSSLEVQLAMGNLLTDKYAEGVANKRFYAGCEYVDEIETAAVNSVKNLFNCDHAFVQPCSGSDANLIAFWSILTQRIQNKSLQNLNAKTLQSLSDKDFEKLRKELNNQTLLGLSFDCGGHLTHGFKQNVSGKMFRCVSYSCNPITERIDYDNLESIAIKEKPLIIVAGYSAYSRKIDFSIMREIADKCGAVLMSDIAHFAGLVAGEVFTDQFNPIPYSHIVTSTTHKTLRGPRGGIILSNNEFAEVIDKGCPLAMGGPLMHVIAAKTIAFREAATREFKTYAHKVVENAQILAQELSNNGIRVVTGGTDNHILILDVSSINLNGQVAELALRTCGITSNRNMIPNDKNGAWVTSGVRLGSAAITTLGMGATEMKLIAGLIKLILDNALEIAEDSKKQIINPIAAKIKKTILDLMEAYPLYPELVIPKNIENIFK